MPATPADAKGMLVQALQSEVPTIVLEHRALYDIEGEVPEAPTPVPFGSGVYLRRGRDVTIVGASLMAYEALRAAEILQKRGVSAEVIDPRSIRPLDWDLIRSSVESTGRLVVVDTSWAMCGFSAEVVARAAETCLGSLKAPPRRVTPPDHPAPVSQPLEDAFHPSPESIVNACFDVMNRNERADTGVPDVQKHFMGPY
jgi:pyruvate dehydrogenase E1 component beta subunit